MTLASSPALAKSDSQLIPVQEESLQSRCQTPPMVPGALLNPVGPGYKYAQEDVRPRLTTTDSSARTTPVNPGSPAHLSGHRHQTSPSANSGTRCANLRTPAASLPVDTTRWPNQNLCMGSLVKGFACQSQSVEIGKGVYFLKCTDTNSRPHKSSVIKET